MGIELCGTEEGREGLMWGEESVWEHWVWGRREREHGRVGWWREDEKKRRAGRQRELEKILISIQRETQKRGVGGIELKLKGEDTVGEERRQGVRRGEEGWDGASGDNSTAEVKQSKQRLIFLWFWIWNCGSPKRQVRKKNSGDPFSDLNCLLSWKKKVLFFSFCETSRGKKVLSG